MADKNDGLNKTERSSLDKANDRIKKADAVRDGIKALRDYRAKVKKQEKESGRPKVGFFKRINTQLGPKIIFAVCASVIPLIIVVSLASAILFKNKVRDVMAEENRVVFNVFENEIELRKSALENTAHSLSSDGMIGQMLSGQTNAAPAGGNGTNAQGGAASGASQEDRLKEMFDDAFLNEYYFGACYDSDGNMIYTFGTMPSAVVHSSADNVVTGYYTDSIVPLSVQCCVPINDMSGNFAGNVVLGFSMADPTIVDAIKTQTGNEVTVFAGDTRLMTTIVDNKTGERVIGTQMGSDIRSIVIGQGLDYSGEGFIVNENMLYKYSPITNSEGAVIGALFAGNSTAKNYSAMDNLMFIIIIASTVILLCLVITLGRCVNNQITFPIKIVVDMAEQIRNGNLHAEPVAMWTNNETSQLAETMNDTVKNLNTYIGDMSAQLSAIADKNLTFTSDVEYVGDFTKLKKSADHIRSNVRTFIEKMDGAADNVSSNSELIANSAQHVATGTTEQAATVQQLSSSIIEVSTNVQKNAENAEKAQQLAQAVNTKIDIQNQQMESMLAAMDDIEKRSTEIQKIIKAIEDIAFQTNILALNAAVEAARAGEAGKGFAVVADEVRNLASKSADAAKNTTELIQATINSVHSGASLVTTAAESMGEVVTLSNESSELIDNISVQSHEQAEQIRQITTGIDQINNVIQSNSATAEEASASSEELFAQAKDLHRIVKEYEL